MKQKNNMEFNKKNKCNYVGIDDATEYAESIKNNVGADNSVCPLLKRNTQKGITLVALVITIIVLLILAAVSIKIALDGGLIEKSKTAVTVYDGERIKESVQLAVAQCQISSEGITVKNLKKALKENGIEESKIGNIDIASGKVTIDGKEYELEEKNHNNNSTTEAKDYSYTEEEKNKMKDDGQGNFFVSYNDNNGIAVAILTHMYDNIEKKSYFGLSILIIMKNEKYIMVPIDEESTQVMQKMSTTGIKIEKGKSYTSTDGAQFANGEIYAGKSPVSKSDFTAEQIYCESYLDKVISNLNS